jgi:hypothetical protein
MPQDTHLRHRLVQFAVQVDMAALRKAKGEELVGIFRQVVLDALLGLAAKYHLPPRELSAARASVRTVLPVDGVPAADSGDLADTQEVQVNIKLSDDAFGTDTERRQLFELDQMLASAVEESGIGEWDSHEFGQGFFTLFLIGPSADALFEAIYPILNQFPAPPGSYVLKRYGQDDEGPEDQKVPLWPPIAWFAEPHPLFLPSPSAFDGEGLGVRRPTAFCLLPSAFCLLALADRHAVEIEELRLRDGQRRGAVLEAGLQLFGMPAELHRHREAEAEVDDLLGGDQAVVGFVERVLFQ